MTTPPPASVPSRPRSLRQAIDQAAPDWLARSGRIAGGSFSAAGPVGAPVAAFLSLLVSESPEAEAHLLETGRELRSEILDVAECLEGALQGDIEASSLAGHFDSQVFVDLDPSRFGSRTGNSASGSTSIPASADPWGSNRPSHSGLLSEAWTTSGRGVSGPSELPSSARSLRAASRAWRPVVSTGLRGGSSSISNIGGRSTGSGASIAAAASAPAASTAGWGASPTGSGGGGICGSSRMPGGKEGASVGSRFSSWRGVSAGWAGGCSPPVPATPSCSGVGTPKTAALASLPGEESPGEAVSGTPPPRMGSVAPVKSLPTGQAP